MTCRLPHVLRTVSRPRLPSRTLPTLRTTTRTAPRTPPLVQSMIWCRHGREPVRIPSHTAKRHRAAQPSLHPLPSVRVSARPLGSPPSLARARERRSVVATSSRSGAASGPQCYCDLVESHEPAGYSQRSSCWPSESSHSVSKDRPRRAPAPRSPALTSGSGRPSPPPPPI
jgi:hypothetical protein